ncbi:MAG: HAD hydrolase family protein, partial [Erysipelotrichaceae bacterium]|nr:HAD hydrolase family protein [Erysipelotrichaceae bacterium]
EKEFFFSSALPVNIEINNPKATKGQAIKRLAELYGFSLDEVMAIGDGDNDMTMLEAAGFFVAMGNGSDILKRKADAVTDTVENEGFAKAIYKYVLNK